MNILKNIKDLNLHLPKVSTPGGNYVSVNVRGKIAYVAIQFPILDGDFLFQGKLGEDLKTEDGYEAMQLCALNVVSQIHNKIGFDKVEGLNHIDAYYRASSDWNESPKVVNGASDLFVNVLEDKGVHSRAIFGVKDLPSNFCVGLTASFTLL